MNNPFLTKNRDIKVRRGFLKMDDLCWEVFKMTGSIDAYLYINEYNNVYGNKEDMRETSIDDDNFEYPGDST